MSKSNWGFGNLYQRGETWWIYYSDHGRLIRESSKSKKRSDAEKLLKTRLAAVSRGTLAEVRTADTTVDEILDDLLRDYEINDKSVEWSRIVVAHLRPVFGKWKAAKVNSVVLDKYVDARRSKGIGNATINRELAILRSAFNKALKRTPPKVSAVPFIPKLKEPPARKGFFEWASFKQLLDRLPPDVADVAYFAYQTGCRRSEILAIKWAQVDLDRRIVRLEAGETKNDEARMIPLTKPLVEMLTRRKAERDAMWASSQWVFSRRGRAILDFKTAWVVACEGAGQSERLFHDLRRTGVRNLVRAGVPEKVAMLISGHKTRSVFDRYNIVDERDLLDAAKMLDAKNEEK